MDLVGLALGVVGLHLDAERNGQRVLQRALWPSLGHAGAIIGTLSEVFTLSD